MRLLIVDDQEVNLSLMKRLLEKKGIRVASAINGKEALEKARRDPPDLVISDILMPVMDGFTLCREWKQDDALKNIPFIFHTATYPDPKDEKLALSLGAERFIVKPVSPAKLFEIIQAVLQPCKECATPVIQEPVKNETEYLKEYNEVLVRKLEDKMLRLHSILNIAPTIMLVLSPDHLILEFNSAAERLYGMKREQVIGKNYLDLFIPKSQRSVIKTQNRKVMGGETIKDFENEVISINGSRKIVSWNVERLMGATGNLVGIVATGADITDRKAAERALRENEKRYRVLFEAANDAIFIMQGENFIDCNQKTLELFGCTKEQIIGKTPFHYSSPIQKDGSNSRKAGQKRIRAVLSGNPQRFEWTHARYDGILFDAEISLNRVQIGSDSYIQAIVRDISERKAVEHQLEQSEQLYRSLFEKNISVMLLIDPENGAIFDANPSACLYYGYSKEKLQTMKITDINVLTKEEVFNEMQRAQSEKRNYFNFRHRLSNGDIRDVEVFSGPITVKGKSLLCSIIHDISERKLAESERERLITELQKTLSEVKRLRGYLPICSSCKRIRDDTGYWNQIEAYIRDHSEAEFSHGICPDCAAKLYPSLV